LEAGYGARASEQAVVVAEPFKSGWEPARAAPYYRQAADTALRRCAYLEAIEHLTTALALLQTQEAPLLIEAYATMSNVVFWGGGFVRAQQYAERALAIDGLLDCDTARLYVSTQVRDLGGEN